jgi:hypothetical protein
MSCPTTYYFSMMRAESSARLEEEEEAEIWSSLVGLARTVVEPLFDDHASIFD